MTLSTIEYEHLPPLPEGTGLTFVLEQVASQLKGDWKSQLQSIYYLRVLLKYNPGQLNNMFQAFGQSLLALLQKGKLPTHLLKIILSLLSEVFFHAQREAINPQIVLTMAPFLLPKSLATEKASIRQEAQKGLSNLVTYCAMMYESFEVLCKHSMDKNPSLSEQAIKLLASLLQSVNSRFMELSPQTLSILIKTLSVLISSKRANIQTFALQICEYIHSLVGNENFSNLLSNLLAPEQVQSLVS